MDWDFENKQVQQPDNPSASQQVGTKAVLVSFGPPMMDEDTDFVVCGFIQNLSLNQQKQIQEIFEVGSGRRYMADGPTRNSLNISRALFSGPSLMKVIATGMTQSEIDASDPGGDELDELFGAEKQNSAAAKFDHAFWMNLGSSIFQNPMGILLEYRTFAGDGKNERDEDYGAVFLQNCKAQSHSIQMQAGQWLMHENMQFRFEAVKPVNDEGVVTVSDYYDDHKDITEKVHNKSGDIDYAEQLSEMSHSPIG